MRAAAPMLEGFRSAGLSMQNPEPRLMPTTQPIRAWEPPSAMGLDGSAVSKLLQGAEIKGFDPGGILRGAGIEPAIYGNASAAIDGQSLVRLVRQIQFTLDDVYLGFLPQGCRLALETERIICLMQAATLGEAVRVSVRFTDAMAPDVGPSLMEEHGAGLKHSCRYQTVPGVDRSVLVWIRFVWIYQFFSWLIGRPLTLRGLTIRGPRPAQENGFDRFAVFHCPVQFNATADSLLYDSHDLNQRLAQRSSTDYDCYYSNAPDWFDVRGQEPSWSARTQQALIDLQKEGLTAPAIQAVAKRLKTNARRLRQNLSEEGECFRDIRTRMRAEIAGAYLVASDIPIQEIGAVLGFSEPGSFSRHFVAWAGMSPSAYRVRYIANGAKVAAATALLTERRALQHA